MKGLLLIGLFLIGCSDALEPTPDCGECGMDIYASNLEEVSEDHYFMKYDTTLAQTYTVLDCRTECGWSNSIGWATDWMYQINNEWVMLVNPGSMTDDEGDANVVFAAWKDFIGTTVTVYGGYVDECGVHHTDEIKITITE